MKLNFKLIALFLVVACLICSFSVFCYAADDIESIDSIPNKEKEYYVPPGFDDLIDVDLYKERAGSPGYDLMKVVGLSSPEIQYVDFENGLVVPNPYYHWRFWVYVYNPLVYKMAVDILNLGTSYEFVEQNGTITLKDTDDTDYRDVKIQNSYGEYTYEFDSYHDTVCVNDAMFFRFLVAGTYSADSVPDGEIIGNFDISKISLDGYLGTDKNGDSIIHPFEFDLDESLPVSYSNYWDNIEHSSPLGDISKMTDISIFDVSSVYPNTYIYEPGSYVSTVDDMFFEVAMMYEDIDSDYLYLYFYNSFGDNFKRGRKGVVKTVGFYDYVNGIESTVVPEYMGSSDTLLKYRIPYDFDLSLEERKYKITFVSSEGSLRSDVFSPKFTMDVVYTFKKDSISTYSVDGGTEEIVLVHSDANYLDVSYVEDSFYRLDSSSTGADYYATLRTACFSIPNRYFKSQESSFNDLRISNISGAYDFAYTGIGLVCKEKIYDMLEPYTNKPCEKPVRINYVPGYATGVVSIPSTCDYFIGANGSGSVDVLLGEFDRFSFLFKNDTDLEGNISNVISSKDLNNAIKNSLNPFASEFEPVEFSLGEEDSFDLLSRNEWSFSEELIQVGWFNAIFGGKREDSLYGIPAFIVFDSESYAKLRTLTDEEFAKNYYVDLSDVSAIRESIERSIANDSSYVLLRFDVYDYYATDDVTVGGIERTGCFAFVDKYYDNFELMNLEFSNSQSVEYVAKVSMQPVTLGVSNVTAPALEKNEDIVDDIKDTVTDIVVNVGDGFGAFKDNLFKGFEKIISVVGVVLIVFVITVALRMVILRARRKRR